MLKKNLLLKIGIVVVLALIGYIVWRGFFAGGGDTAIREDRLKEVAPVKPILSEGSELDFSPVQKYNAQGQLYNYPKPSPDELNLPLPDLIK